MYIAAIGEGREGKERKGEERKWKARGQCLCIDMYRLVCSYSTVQTKPDYIQPKNEVKSKEKKGPV